MAFVFEMTIALLLVGFLDNDFEIYVLEKTDVEVSDDIVEIGDTGEFEVEADSDGRNTGIVRNIEDEAEEQMMKGLLNYVAGRNEEDKNDED